MERDGASAWIQSRCLVEQTIVTYRLQNRTIIHREESQLCIAFLKLYEGHDVVKHNYSHSQFSPLHTFNKQTHFSNSSRTYRLRVVDLNAETKVGASTNLKETEPINKFYRDIWRISAIFLLESQIGVCSQYHTDKCGARKGCE